MAQGYSNSGIQNIFIIQGGFYWSTIKLIWRASVDVDNIFANEI